MNLTSSTKKKIRALIVDDEPLARSLVRKMIGNHPDIEVLGECENGLQAISVIESEKPDLVFLDVQMPEVNGFAVIESLDAEALPHIVFITAFDQYAVKAFEVHALDYLLKPFDQERFDTALDRARKQIQSESNESLNERILALVAAKAQPAGHLVRFIIKSAGRVFFLKSDEIDWIAAEGNYVSLHIGKGAHLFRAAIGTLEQQLDPAKFRRIHRSTIVNIDRIKQLQPWSRGDYQVVLKDGTELRLSHGFRQNLDKDVAGKL
jgi:two-component system, LytTR family, response regulator